REGLVERGTRLRLQGGARARRPVTAREKQIEQLGAAGVRVGAGGCRVARQPAAEIVERRERDARHLVQAIGVTCGIAIEWLEIEPAGDPTEEALRAVAFADRPEPPLVGHSGRDRA